MDYKTPYHGENQIYAKFGCVVVGLRSVEDFEKILPFLSDYSRCWDTNFFRGEDRIAKPEYPLWFSVDSDEQTGWMPAVWKEDGVSKPGYMYYLKNYDGYQIFYSVDEMFDAMNGIAQTPIEMVVGFDDIIM